MPITHSIGQHGFYWRYDHPAGEPGETLDMAIVVAGEVAATEARKARKTYCVASRPAPSPAVYVIACDHPDLRNQALSVMYEFRPDGEVIRHKKSTSH